MSRSLVWLVCGLVAGTGVVAAYDAVGRAHGDALIPRATAAADPQILNADRFGVGALGRVEPASAVRRVGPPGTLTMNRVDRLLVHEGDDVAAGELLAEFADAPIKDAAVQQAEATVAETQAELARIDAGGRPSDIRAQQDQIASLTAQEDIARRDAERARILVPTGAGARAVAERAEAAADRAAALRREAEARLASLAQSRPEDIAVAEARLRSAEASCARARADAAQCRAADRVLTLEDGRIRPQNPSRETRRRSYAMAT